MDAAGYQVAAAVRPDGLASWSSGLLTDRVLYVWGSGVFDVQTCCCVPIGRFNQYGRQVCP